MIIRQCAPSPHASTAPTRPQRPKPPQPPSFHSVQSPQASTAPVGRINVRLRTPVTVKATVPVSLAGVPFLTGQKGNGKSRPAGRAAADGSDPCRGHESVSRFAIRPSTGQSRPRHRTAKGRGDESSGNEGVPQGDTKIKARIPIHPLSRSFLCTTKVAGLQGSGTVLILHLPVFSQRP